MDYSRREKWWKYSILNSIIRYLDDVDTLNNARIWLIDWFLVFNATLSYIMATSFGGGKCRNTRREPPTMGKQLVNLWLRVECTLFCNLQSRVRTHAVMVIGLYKLLGNPTT